jgi:hypothetical protein
MMTGAVMPTEERPVPNLNFDSEHPGARFVVDCELQLEVCKSLLSFADSLPNNLDRVAMQHLVKALPLTWTAHVAFQTEVVLPLLKRRHEGEADVLSCFDHLEQQHVEIAGANDELLDQLEAVARGEAVDSEVLAYVLRNAADRRRQHVEWEKLLLGWMFPQALAPIERQAFLAWTLANPWPFKGIRFDDIGY